MGGKYITGRECIMGGKYIMGRECIMGGKYIMRRGIYNGREIYNGDGDV